MVDDSAHLQALNHANTYVYTAPVHGMCLDVGLHDTVDRISQEERDRLTVETIPVGDIEGDVFRGFEDAFVDEGGRIGGW
jgi:alpha 1,2-mannosyltransferase